MFELKLQGHPSLYQKAIEVPKHEDVTDLIRAMFEIMVSNNGAGLAANQVGSLQRVIFVQTENLKQVFINPKITKRYSSRKQSVERCLSHPGAEVKIKRANRIIVEGFDEAWRPVKLNLTGFNAFVVQHEIDHLNGINIVRKS